MKNVLVIATHPDDEVLGVGGTIPLLKRDGASITVLIVTDGSSAQYPDDSDVVVRKRQQLERANEILGTDVVVHWDLPDMRLDTVPHVELNRRFEALIREGGHDTVFVHHGGDVNVDHQAIFRSVLVATRPKPGQLVTRLYTYFVSSSTEWGARTHHTAFVPNVYVDVEDTLQKKILALDAYSDELREYPHPRSLRAVEERAAVFGSEAGFLFAEPFHLLLQRGSLR